MSDDQGLANLIRAREVFALALGRCDRGEITLAELSAARRDLQDAASNAKKHLVVENLTQRRGRSPGPFQLK
jgi:hypothetical protein